jgi:WhiB family transcriptional regulator, redox-sensing transcriptional regulator
MAQVAQPRLELSTGWQRFGACQTEDGDVFFPPATFETKAERELREAKAKRVCGRCPVRLECLEWSIAIAEPHGVWGGLSESERRKVIAARAQAS